jgi:ATP-binding cassette subfamily B protein
MFKKLSLLRNKMADARQQLPYLPKALGLVRAAAGGWTVLWLVILVLQGLLPAGIVTLTRYLVDNLVEVVGSGASLETIRPTLILVVLLAAAMLLTEILTGLNRWARTVQSELVTDYLSKLTHRKAVSLDLNFYESADFYDMLHRARVDASHRPVALLDNLGSLIQNGITLVAMAVVLLQFGIWLPVVLIGSTLPAFYVVLDYAVRQHRWRMKTTADQRMLQYYDWLMTARETAAELRTFGLGSYFLNTYQQVRERLRNERIKLVRDQGVAEFVAGGLALIVTGLSTAWMLLQAVQGLVTLGELTLFYQAFQQGQKLMRSLLNNTGQIYSNILFLGNLFEYLELEPGIPEPLEPTAPPIILQDGIRFEGIAFHYPGSERKALDDFDLDIPAGQVVAIVGANGAGKSTLVKLLCRLYDPDEGGILVDGIDLRDMPTTAVRKLVTVLFQEPVSYTATAGANIALGDLEADPSEEEIRHAAKAAGADELIMRLPHKYQTLLGKWFAGGAELSVGEWQRVALARAFLRRAEIIVLDEPTSAMDSWAETAWMERFRELARERTAVIITHRFTTAMRADMIHVMDRGQIVESGTHRELLQQDGRYAQSWRSQIKEHAAEELS